MTYKNFDLNLLTLFNAVYRHKNIARASEELTLTASAVGMRIKQLESQIGAQLFIRQSKGLSPTIEGENLYNKTSELISNLFTATQNIGESNKDTVGHIKIACPPYIQNNLIIDATLEFCKAYPNIMLEFMTATKAESESKLANFEIDLIIRRLPFYSSHNFSIELLHTSENGFYATHTFIQDHLLKVDATLTHPSTHNIECTNESNTTTYTPQKTTEKLPLKMLEILPLALKNKQLAFLLEATKATHPNIKFNRLNIEGLTDLILEITKKHKAIGYLPNHVAQKSGLVKIEFQDAPVRTQEIAIITNPKSKNRIAEKLRDYIRQVKF